MSIIAMIFKMFCQYQSEKAQYARLLEEQKFQQQQILDTKREFECIQNFMDDNRAWTNEVFPGATTLSSLRHLESEVREAIEAEEQGEMFDGRHVSLMEFADMYLIFLNSASRKGFSFEDIHRAGLNKMWINRNRKWGPQNEQGYYEHIEQ